jgi:hypothetical protein
VIWNAEGAMMNVQTARPQSSKVPNVELGGDVIYKSPMGDNETKEQWPVVHRTRNGNRDPQNELLQILNPNSHSFFRESVGEYYSA